MHEFQTKVELLSIQPSALPCDGTWHTRQCVCERLLQYNYCIYSIIGMDSTENRHLNCSIVNYSMQS